MPKARMVRVSLRCPQCGQCLQLLSNRDEDLVVWCRRCGFEVPWEQARVEWLQKKLRRTLLGGSLRVK